MARLNDFAAPSESVEALKRRFVRQNREIARVNSLQSLRIRSLESEVSHLLAENVSLREQVINLTQEIERLEAAKLLHDGVYEIKGRLDTKLAELNTLVSDLGSLPRKVGKLGGEKSVETHHSKATAPERPRMTDQEYHAGFDDGRLPAILEDKHYPRRTLDPQEIQQLMHANPDLSRSPRQAPLAHPEPLRTSDSPSQESAQSPSECQAKDDATGPNLPLQLTLETRRKQRIDAAALEHEERASPEHHGPNVDLSTPAKSGAKRKFSPDDGILCDTAPEDDEFQFSRPSQSPQKLSDRFEFSRQHISPSKGTAGAKSESAKQSITKRKVLEPKSANANFGSPKKARSVLKPDKKTSFPAGGDENMRSPAKPKELGIHKSKGLGQKPRNRSAPALQKQRRSCRTPDSGEVIHIQSQDTPTVLKDSPVAQSAEGLPGMEDLTAASRPSRRQRAVVSYAEPNLRDKMRRPTSEMIDAVGGHGSRRSSSFQLGREGMSEEDAGSRMADVKPSPRAINNLPADFVLATQSSMEGFVRGGTPDQLSAAVSRRRQSRRHSSNPKTTGRDVSPQRDLDNGNASTLEHMSPSPSGLKLDDEQTSDWNSTSSMDTKFRRETRVAARRKSMMV